MPSHHHAHSKSTNKYQKQLKLLFPALRGDQISKAGNDGVENQVYITRNGIDDHLVGSEKTTGQKNRRRRRNCQEAGGSTQKETASGTAQEDHTQAQTETGTQTGCSVPGDRGTCGHCFFC